MLYMVAFFKKIFKTTTREENIKSRYYIYSDITMMKLKLILRRHFYRDKTRFELFYVEI